MKNKNSTQAFEAHFDANFAHRLQSMEELRKKEWNRIKGTLFFSAILATIIIAWATSAHDSNFLTFLFIPLFISIISMTGTKFFAAKIKKKIVPEIVKIFFGEDADFRETSATSLSIYTELKGLSKEEVEKRLEENKKSTNFIQNLIPSFTASKIIPSHNKSQLEDIISGNYKKSKVVLFEARLINEDDDGDEEEVFKGVFLKVDFPKKFQSHTVVRTDGGKIGNWLKKTFSSLKPIKLVDPVFEKQFEVYGTDQTEGRYLVDSMFMGKMLELQKLFSLKYKKPLPLECAFYEGSLLLKISTKENFFEPASLFQPLSKEGFLKIYHEFHLFTEIIDLVTDKLKTKVDKAK